MVMLTVAQRRKREHPLLFQTVKFVIEIVNVPEAITFHTNLKKMRIAVPVPLTEQQGGNVLVKRGISNKEIHVFLIVVQAAILCILAQKAVIARLARARMKVDIGLTAPKQRKAGVGRLDPHFVQ